MCYKPDSNSDSAQNSEQQVYQHHPDAGHDASRQREREQEQLAVTQPPLGGERALHRRTSPLRSFDRRNVGHRRADRPFAVMWQEQYERAVAAKGQSDGAR
jgi:hypothetical protein